MNAFIFTYSAAVSHEEVHAILNVTRAVKTWASPFPSCAIIVSDLSVDEITAVLETHLPNVWFMVVQAKSHMTNGWLPSAFWEYINEPDGAYTKKLLADLAPPLGRLGSVSPPPPPPWSLADLIHPDAKKKK